MMENVAELAKALVEVQAQLTNPAKSRENPHFKSRYADLVTCLDTAKPVLTKHGIALFQAPRMDGDTIIVETTLLHVSGQSISAPVGCKLGPRQDAQAVGSAITYLRRYGLCAMVGIAAADEDDDGNAASGKGKDDRNGGSAHFGDPPRKTAGSASGTATAPHVDRVTAQDVATLFDATPVDAVPEVYITEPQRKLLHAALKAGNHNRVKAKDWLATEHGVDSTTTIPSSLFETLRERFADPTPFPGE